MIQSIPQTLHIDGLEPRTNRGGSFPDAFGKGTVLRGKVLKTAASGTVLVRICGQNVTARTDMPLRQGMEILLSVRQNRGPVVLQLLPKAHIRPFSPNIATVLSAMGGNLWKTLLARLDKAADRRKSMVCLKQNLDDWMHFSRRNPAPDAVKNTMDRSGLFWEVKLRQLAAENRKAKTDLSSLLKTDLKGALAECMTVSEEKTAPVIRHLFLALEHMQLLNYSGRLNSGWMLLPLPVRMSDGSATIAQLMVQPEPEEDGEKTGCSGNGFRLLLVADFTVLGPLRIDLHLRKGCIRVAFSVSRDSAQQALSNAMPLLREQMTARGFSFEYAGCLVRDAGSVLQNPLLEMIETAGVNLDCRM